VDVTTTYLELRDVAGIRPARDSDVDHVIVEVTEPAPEFARFLYATVGADWSWTDRLGWTREEWRSRMDRPGVETWVMWVRGAPAGYAELDSRPEADGSVAVELAYFGLLPAYVGRGLGGVLLEAALRRAWAMNEDAPTPTSRVWVHTCTLDGPHALANYRNRGLRVYRTETEQRSDG
jgi:GNAT superfamily N-acetyltransferase